MNLSDGLVTARLDVETPRISLHQMFSTYQSSIEQLMREKLSALVTDGVIAEMAVAELKRQLPGHLEKTVRESLWQIQLDDVLKTLVAQAFQNIIKESAK